MAAGRDRYLTKVGIDTYLDPRHGGGKLNARTTEDIVSLATVDGVEHIVYPTLPIDVAFIQASVVDEDGNVSLEDEAATMNVLYQALAAKRFGGRVIVQARRQVVAGQIPPRLVAVPGILVDAVVINPAEEREDSTGTMSFLLPAHRIAAPPSRRADVTAAQGLAALADGSAVDESCPEVRRSRPTWRSPGAPACSWSPAPSSTSGAGLPLRDIPPVASRRTSRATCCCRSRQGCSAACSTAPGSTPTRGRYLDTPGIFSLYGSGLIRSAFFSMWSSTPTAT